MNNSLKFQETLSVEAFKATNKVSTIEIIENPKNGKVFFSCNTSDGEIITGAVSGEIDAIMEQPMMSKVAGTTGESFWMLHKKQSNNVKATL